MPQTNNPWLPPAGMVVAYAGRNKKTARNVKVVAEATGGCMVVEAIGRKGYPVRVTVKRESLRPLQPGLFD